jgi:hypothetical protein
VAASATAVVAMIAMLNNTSTLLSLEVFISVYPFRAESLPRQRGFGGQIILAYHTQ